MKLGSAYLFPLILILSHSVSANENTKNTYNWTGIYVGGFIGGAASTNINSTEPQSNGFYWNTYSHSNNYDTDPSFIGGGTVGYNWQFAGTPFLLGFEGEYGYLNMSGSNPDSNAALWSADHPGYPADNGTHRTNIGGQYGYGLVGGRIGYALNRTLFYVKSGAVFTKTQTNYNDPAYDVSMSGKSNNAGYAIGAGIEYALPFKWAKSVSIKTEYLYLGIDRTLTSYGDNGFPFTTSDRISGIHTAKLGVNYKF